MVWSAIGITLLSRLANVSFPGTLPAEPVAMALRDFMLLLAVVARGASYII